MKQVITNKNVNGAQVNIYKTEGEYRCRLVINDIHQPNADYYCADKQDAVKTAHAMLTAKAIGF